MGVGETASYALENPDFAIRVADCGNPWVVRRLLTRLRDWASAEIGRPIRLPTVDDVTEAYRQFAGTVRTGRLPSGGPLVFEGAQGVLPRRVVRLPPLHDLGDHHVHQRVRAARRGRDGRREAAGRRADVHDPDTATARS